MPTERIETPYDRDINNAEDLVKEPAHACAGPYAPLAQALALISIAKTLRRIELRLPKP